MSRGDEAIAAAELLAVRDELQALRQKEQAAARALDERAEVTAARPRPHRGRDVP